MMGMVIQAGNIIAAVGQQSLDRVADFTISEVEIMTPWDKYLWAPVMVQLINWT
jgi:hypothetical protein